MAATQAPASVPPIHTGLVIQYRKLLTAPTRRPKASLVQKYGPPSCGKAEPSSANSDRVDADDRADKEEQDVEATEMTLQFGALSRGGSGGLE
jgi:hypothetical protein